MKRLKGSIAAAGGFVMTFLVTNLALAQNNTNGSNTITLCDPLGNNCKPGTETFASVTNNVVYFLSTTIAIPLTVIMVLVGAFQIITAGGDPEKFSSGRKTILYAGIGFAIALIATGVTTLISSIINGH